MTRRYCLTLDLKDDAKLIAEYKRCHEKIWPERVGPGVGAARASVRAVCGRLQHLRSQPTGRGAHDGKHRAIHRREAQAQGERREERGSGTTRVSASFPAGLCSRSQSVSASTWYDPSSSLRSQWNRHYVRLQLTADADYQAEHGKLGNRYGGIL
jgi:hypothetical protein